MLYRFKGGADGGAANVTLVDGQGTLYGATRLGGSAGGLAALPAMGRF